MYPEDIFSDLNIVPYGHVTVNSALMGFIDDFYFSTSVYTPAVGFSGNRVVSFQSQLRLGSGDFDQNYYHIKTILDCLNTDNALSGITPVGIPAPCSGV